MKKVFYTIALSIVLCLCKFSFVFVYANDSQRGESKVALGAFLPEIPIQYYGGEYYDEKYICHKKIVDVTPEGKEWLLSLQEYNTKMSAVSELNAEIVFEGGAVYSYEQLEKAQNSVMHFGKDENRRIVDIEIEFDEKPILIDCKIDARQNCIVIVAKEWNETAKKKISELLDIKIEHIIFETANYTKQELREAIDKIYAKRKELNVSRVDVLGNEYSIFVVAEEWNTELKKKVIEISGLKEENIMFLVYRNGVYTSDVECDKKEDYLINKIKEAFKMQ
ncbi:hypothetical protein [Clostridium sp. MD294]|uniref:hypothetical protein n=1 Tax=Clostridium sp. MD294 TaxID=97138 RepID=UPI0002C9EC43|nr:hypothetical protein [Clostridium sp. MD294]NDO47384.1 hypothetical protein [Clostridium sp. MD294]USF29546.1 hypothetical protein C820_000937 [Clostridium sp. MD294]